MAGLLYDSKLFLPFAGLLDASKTQSKAFASRGNYGYGYYWSADGIPGTLTSHMYRIGYSGTAVSKGFDISGTGSTDYTKRHFGMSIRCVADHN